MDKQQLSSTEFKTLMEYAKEMNHRYFRAISAFYAFEALKEVRAPNIVGQSDAVENGENGVRKMGSATIILNLGKWGQPPLFCRVTFKNFGRCEHLVRVQSVASLERGSSKVYK